MGICSRSRNTFVTNLKAKTILEQFVDFQSICSRSTLQSLKYFSLNWGTNALFFDKVSDLWVKVNLIYYNAYFPHALL